jgi:hypothetical protein
MNWQYIAELLGKLRSRYSQSWVGRLPAKARIILALSLVAAVLLALHTALSGKDSSLHLRVQHGFRSAQLSVWIDDDLAYSGKLQGVQKKKFGLIPESVQGSLSEVVPVSAGRHRVRVRIETETGSAQEEDVTGNFPRDTERELLVSAHASGLSLAWQASDASADPSSGPSWLARYAGPLLLSIVGPIISALTGFVLKELPVHLRARQTVDPKPQSTVAGQ